MDANGQFGRLHPTGLLRREDGNGTPLPPPLHAPLQASLWDDTLYEPRCFMRDYVG